MNWHTRETGVIGIEGNQGELTYKKTGGIGIQGKAGGNGELAYKGNKGNWHYFSQLLKFPVSKQHIHKNYSILKLTNRK